MFLKAIARICFVLLLANALSAQSAAMLQVDSSQVETGNPYVLHLSVPGNKTPDSLNFGPWLSFFDPKNLVSQTPWRRSGGQYSSDVTVVFFDADSLSLPPLGITFNDADTVFTNPLKIVVYPTPSPDDPADMAPIKNISQEPVLWTDYLPIALSVVVGIAVLWLLFWWISRRKQIRLRSQSISLSSHALALKKLGVLAQKALWRSDAVKEHCAELTFILREYLEKRYEVPALESTSEELLSRLKSTDFPMELRPDLENILAQADLAKFAKAIPPEEFYLYSLDFAQALVTQTIPPPPVEEPANQ